ncbi:MAG: hypothetical protein K2Y17_08810 [Qipengyuania sp.]|jgi:hypothetical protein|nr:hypothetical protein [Qipengyuania sp.]
MAQRRPITSHPAFAPFLALWFAALLGLGVAVLPAPLLERALGALGAAALVPLTAAGRLMASGVAAAMGAALGLALALPLYRRGRRDPRPIYAEPELPVEHSVAQEPVRRPLRVREELAEHAPEAAGEGGSGDGALSNAASGSEPPLGQAEEGFMILTPQPVHPPRPAQDIDTLLEQFDSALAAFRTGDESRSAGEAGDPDPVRAFVARQTGTPAPSPLGGRMPDHQAELRAALDKLARAHRKD